MAYIDSVGLSMDGSPQTQDTQRPLASGKGSSRWVMQTLRELEANHRSYLARRLILGKCIQDRKVIRFSLTE
jgi:sulfatase maturation enzyme AslB (radical SAM superfamily)